MGKLACLHEIRHQIKNEIYYREKSPEELIGQSSEIYGFCPFYKCLLNIYLPVCKGDIYILLQKQRNFIAKMPVLFALITFLHG